MFKYETNRKAYQDVFDNLFSRVEISEEHSISFYLGGLPPESEMGGRMFRQNFLADAYCLTNRQEATLNAMKKKNKLLYSNGSGACESRVDTVDKL